MKALQYIWKIYRALAYLFLTSLCKKNKKLWVFGAWKGTTYNDNTKYLFEYVCQKEPDIEAVWITKNKQVYEQLVEMGYKVSLWPSRNAKRIVRTAGFLFQTEGNLDTGEFRVGRTQVIQLWHGIAIKHHDWYSSYSTLKKYLITLYTNNHAKSIWCSPSEYNSKIISEIMNVPLKQFYITGCPRNDSFVSRNTKHPLAREIEKSECTPVIYLPTHRNFGKDFNAQFIIDGLQKIEPILVEKKVLLCYKPHPNEARMLNDVIQEQQIKLNNIKILVGQQYDDLYSYLHLFECLITDYSSVVYDYICTGKPIIFFNYDLNQYMNTDAGIVKEYFDYQSGPFCKTWEDVATNIVQLLFGKDDWIQRREECRRHINPFNDGSNCARVVDLVKRI